MRDVRPARPGDSVVGNEDEAEPCLSCYELDGSDVPDRESE